MGESWVGFNHTITDPRTAKCQPNLQVKLLITAYSLIHLDISCPTYMMMIVRDRISLTSPHASQKHRHTDTHHLHGRLHAKTRLHAGTVLRLPRAISAARKC